MKGNCNCFFFLAEVFSVESNLSTFEKLTLLDWYTGMFFIDVDGQWKKSHSGKLCACCGKHGSNTAGKQDNSLCPPPTKLKGGYTGFRLSVRPSVLPSVC